LKKFQEILPDYRLICVYTGRNNDAVAFSPYDPKKKDLVIVHMLDHYHGCSSLNGLYQTSDYCEYCLKGYDHKGRHRCKKIENKLCKCCRRRDCPDFLVCHPQHLKANLLCEPCGRYFFGPTCLQNHLKYNIAGEFQPHNSVCKQVRHCKECGKLNSGYQNIQEHKCRYAVCPNCKAYANLHHHRCFIESANEVKRKKEELKRAKKRRAAAAENGTPIDPEPMDILEEFLSEEDALPASQVDPPEERKKAPLHVYFDLEARQDDGTHIANLCVYQTDEGEERIIRGEDCVKTFIEDLKAFTEEDTRKVVVIAHNLQSYDGYFVIKELYKDQKTVTQIRCGAKILEISHYDIRFIDSLNFFAFPLSDFPKTFGLKLYAKDDKGHFITDQDGNYVEHPLAKGNFPHLFNRVENQRTWVPYRRKLITCLSPCPKPRRRNLKNGTSSK